MTLTRDSDVLAATARRVRLNIVRMVGVGRKGHLGGSCSIADVVTALYFAKMRHDPTSPAWPDRDRLILSKGHAALVQYAALAECGYFPPAHLPLTKSLGAVLQGHPDLHATPGIEANNGSLGQGLSIACGMAAGLRLDGRPSRVYCVLGDGELAEGQVWEAAMSAARFRLDRLVAIVDANGLQATGRVADRSDSGPLPGKWRAFGWHVEEIDGHDMGAILAALDRVDLVSGVPKAIIARTVKGRGVSFAEHNVAFHNGSLTADEYAQACRELGGMEAS